MDYLGSPVTNWPVCRFTGQTQQPSDSRYLLFLWQQSLQCSWTSSLELSAERPQTTGLGIQQFQIVAEDGFILSVRSKRSVSRCPRSNCALSWYSGIYFLTYLLTYLLICLFRLAARLSG